MVCSLSKRRAVRGVQIRRADGAVVWYVGPCGAFDIDAYACTLWITVTAATIAKIAAIHVATRRDMTRRGMRSKIAMITATTTALNTNNPAFPNIEKTDAATGLPSEPPDPSATAVVTQSNRLKSTYDAAAKTKAARSSRRLSREKSRPATTLPV